MDLVFRSKKIIQETKTMELILLQINKEQGENGAGRYKHQRNKPKPIKRFNNVQIGHVLNLLTTGTPLPPILFLW